MYSPKRRLHQAPPLTTDQVYRLEKFVCSEQNVFLRTIAGTFLFCLYSCARFGETAKGPISTLDFQRYQHFYLIEATLTDYKTASAERRSVGLPLLLGVVFLSARGQLRGSAPGKPAGLIG